MPERVSWWKRVVTVLPMLLLCALLIASLFALAEQKRAGDWLLHTDEVRLSVGRLRTRLFELETEQRSYLVTDDARARAAERLGQWTAELERLRLLTSDNPEQQERITRLNELIHRRLDVLDHMATAYENGARGDELAVVMARDKQAMEDVRSLLRQIEDEEIRLGYLREHRRDQQFGGAFALMSGTAFTVVLMFVGGRWRRTLALTRKKHMAERSELLNEVERGRLRLHELVMQTPVPIAVVEGPDLRFSLWNEAYARLLGGRELAARPIRDVLDDPKSASALDALFETYRTGEPRTLVDHEVLVVDAEGKREARFFTASYQPTRDQPGTVTGVILVGIDLTEQVRARRRLEASLRFYEQFIGILGHDLRNPLNAIVMATTLLRLKPDCDPKTIERIFRSSTRIARMIDQLLDLARSRIAGGIPLNRQPTALGEVVCKSIEDLRRAHPKRAIDWEPTVVPAGQWDTARLSQVISTLIGNALEHGEPSRPVEVRLHSTSTDVELSVHSYGPAMSPDLLTSVFNPYRRGARSQRSSGFGVGLFISQQIALAHGGDVRATSSEIDGTVFTLTLPLVPHELRSVA